MFSFQFGTFESSTPMWFDWLSLIVSVLTILATYCISRSVLEAETKAIKKRDDDISLEQFKNFEETLKAHNEFLKIQVSHLEEYLENFQGNNITSLKIVPEVQFDILYGMDINRLYKVASIKNIDINEFRRLIININKTDNTFKSIKNEVFKTFEKIDSIDRPNSVTQYELMRKHFFELLTLLKDNQFREKHEDTVREYGELIKKTNKNKSIIPNEKNNIIKKNELEELFYKPLLEIISNNVMDEQIFVEIASKINYAINDLNNIRIIEENHIQVIKAYKKLFENTTKLIDKIFPHYN